MNTNLENKENQPPAVGVEHSPVQAATPHPVRRGGVPLAALVPLVLVASGIAYFVGRGAVSPPPPATTQEASIEEGKAADSASGGLITLSPDAEKTAGIQTATVKSLPLAQTLTVPGVVEVAPNKGAAITPPVAGKVIELAAQPGDTVSAGQLLARLDSLEVAQAHAAVREADSRVAEAKAAVQSAEAGLEQARTKAVSAQSALSRQKELAASGQLSQPSLQAAQNTLAEAQASKKEADAALALARSVASRAERLFNAQIAPRAELEQAQTAVEQAEAQAEKASQQVTVAQTALTRERRVFGSGILNRQAVQGSAAELAAAQGDVRQAQKQVQSARTALSGAIVAQNAAVANLSAVEGSGHAEGGAGRIALHSPIAGTIAERRVSIGQAVERASTLFTVQNLSLVTVVASVPEANAAQVRVGSAVSVTVTAYPKTVFTGVVQSIGGAVDEKTRALPVRCLVRNSGGVLKPEMFARVSLGTGGTRAALAVPDAAVDEDGEERFVYVAADGGYEKRTITVGKTVGGRTEIVSGVKEGEKVVTDGMFVVKSESKKSELKEEE